MGAANTCCCTQEDIEAPAAVILEGDVDERSRDAVPPAMVDVSAQKFDMPDQRMVEPFPGLLEKPQSNDLAFEFLVDGDFKTVTFSKRPLGMTFANKLPLTVTKIVPGTEAEIQNVQPGWVFTKVAGVSLTGMDLENIVSLIQEKSRNLACDSNSAQAGLPTSITFEFDVNGEHKAVTFYKRPLGMTFANKLPLTVTKIVGGSEAETRGVQAGWVFTKVADIPLGGMDLERIVSLILEKSVNLPMDR